MFFREHIPKCDGQTRMYKPQVHAIGLTVLIFISTLSYLQKIKVKAELTRRLCQQEFNIIVFSKYAMLNKSLNVAHEPKVTQNGSSKFQGFKKKVIKIGKIHQNIWVLGNSISILRLVFFTSWLTNPLTFSGSWILLLTLMTSMTFHVDLIHHLYFAYKRQGKPAILTAATLEMNSMAIVGKSKFSNGLWRDNWLLKKISAHFSENKWVNVKGSTSRKNKFNKLQADNDTLRAKATIFRSILNQKQGGNTLYLDLPCCRLGLYSHYA